jgi:hypothetical protein
MKLAAMRSAGWALLGFLCVTAGCTYTEYPVIFDSRGPYDNNVLIGQYEQAYIIPTGQVATIWDDGSDETYTLVQQDWTGDQWLRTYNNFDPTASVIFLGQTYCDPTRQSDCEESVSWNPNLPSCENRDNPHPCDDIFDYTVDYSTSGCSGARSLCVAIAASSRIGECGSGLARDRQGLAAEFTQLASTTFRNRPAYALPMDSNVMSVRLTARDGASALMPIFGRYEAYLDEQLRFMTQVSSNVRYQIRWVQNWTRAHGSEADMLVTYGSFQATVPAAFRNLDQVLDRL